MTHQQWIQCFVACFIGNIIHVIFKIRSLQKDHKTENMKFSMRKYVNDDKWALIGDLAGSFAMVYVADEWLGTFGNYFIDKTKTLFVFVGMWGSFVITHLFGAAKDRFRKEVKAKRDAGV
jgi:hypothetical protein